MITFITGVPGASKTLNTLEMIQTDWGEGDRPIYYRGIKELTFDWNEISDDEVKNWWNLPQGSIIFVDEAQQIWPSRPNNKPMPESVARLDTHRHGGYDFYIITQKSTLVDHSLRAFVGRHLHYERPFGHNTVRCLEWQKCIDKVDDYHSRQEALITRKKMNKKYFGVYKSAEIHTIKKRIPAKVWGIGALILSCFGLAGYAYSSISGRSEEYRAFDESNYSNIPNSVPGQIAPQSPYSLFSDESVLTPEQYLETHVPRIDFMPHSAPLYDGVTEVKTFPRPQCMYRHKTNRCSCFTQQATPLNIPLDMCIDIVNNGWFNPYYDEESARAEALAARASWTIKPSNKPFAPNIIVLDSSL